MTTSRIPDINGWGYATFLYDAAGDPLKPSTDNPVATRTLCHSCHTPGAKARDFVYTAFGKW